VCAGAEGDVSAVEPGDLRDTQSGLDSEREDGLVASAFPTGRVWSVEECLGFVVGEERDDGFVEPFLGDSEHTGDGRGVFGMAQGGVAEQRSDGGKAGVAGPGRVPALHFQMGQERGDRRGVEVIEAERARRLAGVGGREGQQ